MVESDKHSMKLILAFWTLHQKLARALLVLSVASMSLAGCASRQGTGVAELPSLIDRSHHVGPLAFSPDGKAIVLPDEGGSRVEVWDIATRRVRYLESPFDVKEARVCDVVFSQDGRLLASDFEPGGAAVHEVAREEKGLQIPIPRPTWIVKMAFQRGAPKLVAIMDSNSADAIRDYSSARWDALTGRLEETCKFGRGLLFLSLSPDARFVLFHDGREYVAMEPTSGRTVVRFPGSGEAIFSSDGSKLVSYDGKSVTQWAIPAGKMLGRVRFGSSQEPPGYPIQDCLSLSPDNRLLAVGCFREVNTVAVIGLTSGKVLGTFACCPPSMFCSRVYFSPDGRILATDTEQYDQNDHPVKPLLKFWRIPDGW